MLRYPTFTVFAVLTAITAYNHEPWADEANSWLLGRDASLYELWSRLMHYEGTPALWQTLLHVLIRLGLPYSALNFFTGLLGCAAAWIFMSKAPFPTPIRLAMPFTFYLFYQYSVVARSYCLLPILLFLCARIYHRAEEKPGLLTALLCLTAGVSVHGMMISGAIWISFQWKVWRRVSRRKLLAIWLTYAVVVLFLAWSAWPAKDTNFASDRDTSFEHMLSTTGETLANAFTGEWISSFVVIALCLPFLWRGGGLPMFAIAGCGLCVFNSLVYANVWHEGMLFLAWLVAMWIAAERTKPNWMAAAAMAAVISMQGYWAFKTTAFDWEYPYSGSKAAARYLRENGILGPKLFAVGFACVGIQPYFERNIFPNFRDGRAQGYYDWSEAFRNFEGGLDRLPTPKPEYVIVGYKDTEEKNDARIKAAQAGYALIRNFDGNLYWHDQVLEPDAFDLYRRN